MAKKFSNSDLFEQGLFDDPIQKAEQFLVLIRDIEKSSAKAIKEQAKVLKDFSKISGLDELRKIKEAIDKINQSTDTMLKLKREERQLEDKLNSAKTEQAKHNEKLKQSINEQNKATREQIKNEKALIDIQNKEIKTIQQLQEKNNALIRTRKNLDLTTKEGVKDYQRLTNEIRRNNTELKKHDAAVGSYTRNVGNYGSAIKGFGTQLLGVLGAGSFLMVAQNAVAINAKFGQSMADLKVITGATDEQMQFFEKTALEQTKTMEGSTASATQYAEALKLIASAKPELLQNSQALKEVTDQALILADASGLELPDAATRLTDAMNQFGAGADQASKFVNVLAGSAKFGSAEIPQVTEALLEFGPVAKSYNVSISESAAAIEGLAEKGIKGSEAGTKLRNVLLALGAAKGLPKEAQESFERAGIDVNILSDNSLSLNQRLTELSKAQNDEVAMLKIFGKENISAAKSVLSQKDRILELTKNIDNYTDAGDDAANRTGTLSAEMQKLSNAWQTAMIEFGRGGGDLAKTVKFIRQNLDSIITVVTKVVKGFLIYKGTVLAVNTAMKIGQGATALYGTAMSLFAKSTEGATKSFKALDASMKANVIGMVAVAVYELADALGVFTSEAETAQQVFETSTGVFDKIIAQEDEMFNRRIDAMKKNHQNALELAKDEEKELIKINQTGELRSAYQKKYNEIQGDLVEITSRRKKNLAELKQLDADYRKSNDDGYKYENIEQQKAVMNEIKIQDSKILTLKTQKKNYNQAISDLNHQEAKDAKQSQDEITESLKQSNSAKIADYQRKADEIKRIELDLKKYLEDLNAENIDDERQREIEQERLRFEREKQSIDEKYSKIGELTKEQTEQKNQIEIQLEEQHQDKLQKIRQKYDDVDLQKKMDEIEFEFTLLEDSATRKIKDEQDLQNALEQLAIDKLKREIQLLQDAAADKKEIADKQLELDKLLREQQNKTLDDAKEKQDAIAKAIKSGLDATKDALQKQKERTKDLIDAAQTLADELTNIFTEASKKREEILDKEIENSKNRQDQLREIADRGVLEADQSLAAEERKQAELERKKMQEQKKQQRIELANTAFKAYTGHVENRDASPLSSTIRDITALTAFISSLPAFFEGTENTGKGGNLDNKGGFTAVLHPNERVMTAEQNKELAGLTNNDVVRIVKESESVKLHSSDAVNNMKMAERFAIDMSWKTNEQIINKVDELIKTVENKPVQFVYVDQISNKLVSEIKKGNNSIKTHYSKPNING